MIKPKKPRALLAIGTRPEVIKMAPVYYALKERGMDPVLLHTGQHSDMASSLYELFGIVPDYNLLLAKPTGACELSSQSSTLLQNVSNAMMEVDPSVVLVHGDTSSALMSAMAAFYQKRPIAHVEAGLRSHKEYNPFPEEKNRVLIGQLARWHFAPTESAKNNLLKEGVAGSHIHVVGNTVVEAAELGGRILEERRKVSSDPSFKLVERLESQLAHNQKILMVTMHRRENHGNNIQSVAQAVMHIMETYPELVVVWPVHPNPKVKATVHGALATMPPPLQARLHLTEPLNYPVLLWVLKHSWLALTDSGGIQEEAVALNTPVLVLRNTTERPEVIDAGAGILVGTGRENIIEQVTMLYQQPTKYESMRQAKNPYGNGTTASRICDILIGDNFLEKKHA